MNFKNVIFVLFNVLSYSFCLLAFDFYDEPACITQTAFEKSLISTSNHKRVLSLGNPVYVFFNHPTSTYDTSRSSSKATLHLLDWAKSRGIETILTFEENAANPTNVAGAYYLSSKDVTHPVSSDSGQHQIQFNAARTIFFAGGNGSMCLCEAIRDAIYGAVSTKDPTNIVMVKDAVYESGIDADFRSISGVLSSRSQSELKSFFEQHIVDYLQEFCPKQNHGKELLKPYDFEFRLFHNAELVEVYVERAGLPVINFYFADLDKLDALFLSGASQTNASLDSLDLMRQRSIDSDTEHKRQRRAEASRIVDEERNPGVTRRTVFPTDNSYFSVHCRWCFDLCGRLPVVNYKLSCADCFRLCPDILH